MFVTQLLQIITIFHAVCKADVKASETFETHWASRSAFQAFDAKHKYLLFNKLLLKSEILARRTGLNVVKCCVSSIICDTNISIVDDA